jgi:hypothetical protein
VRRHQCHTCDGSRRRGAAEGELRLRERAQAPRARGAVQCAVHMAALERQCKSVTFNARKCIRTNFAKVPPTCHVHIPKYDTDVCASVQSECHRVTYGTPLRIVQTNGLSVHSTYGLGAYYLVATHRGCVSDTDTESFYGFWNVCFVSVVVGGGESSL